MHLKNVFEESMLCHTCGGETGLVPISYLPNYPMDLTQFSNLTDITIKRLFVLEPSNTCTCRCIHCRRYYERDIFPHISDECEKKFMSFALWRKISDELDDLKQPLDLMLHWRAESFSNPNTVKMFQYLIKKKFQKWIIFDSNLNNLNKNKIEALFKSILEGYDVLQTFEFSFSIDAYDKNVYDKIRTQGKFEQVIRNAKEIIRVRNTLNLNKVHLRIQYIVEPLNYLDTAKFISFWENIINFDLDKIYIKRCHGKWPFSNQIPNLYLTTIKKFSLDEQQKSKPYLLLDLDPEKYYKLDKNKIYNYAD